MIVRNQSKSTQKKNRCHIQKTHNFFKNLELIIRIQQTKISWRKHSKNSQRKHN